MKLPTEGARWFVHLRWVACAIVFGTVVVGWALHVISDPLPLLWVGAGMAACNSAFWFYQRRLSSTRENVDRHIALQILCDVSSLALLLYFSDLTRNPFLYFFSLPMIIAGMYLRGRTPYYFGAFVTVLVGGVMWLEYRDYLPRFPVRFAGESPPPLVGGYLIATFVAFASTLWITLYFAKSIRRYVDRAHAELRQKEKMLGIGQLVAGIAHQIANPLDGVQNCLRRIGERVKDDPQLTEYVQLMEEALDRIEKTAKRVQSFARPRGIELQATSVNAAVESTLAVARPAAQRGNHDRDRAGRRAAGPRRRVYLAGGALQPVHERDRGHARRRRAQASHGCHRARTTTSIRATWRLRFPIPAWASRAGTWRKSSSRSSPPGRTRAAPVWGWACAGC